MRVSNFLARVNFASFGLAAGDKSVTLNFVLKTNGWVRP